VVAVLSTATIAILPYDTGLQQWATGHIGQWTPAIGEVTPVVGSRVGYVAGNSAFAAGYLIVLLISPLAGCAFGAWGGYGRRGWRGLRMIKAWPRIKRSPIRARPARQDQ